MKSVFRTAASLALLLSSCAPLVQGATKDEWRTRSIYRLLTDRFAPATENAPCDVRAGQYCGGSFKTIMSKLDYIQNDLGFDAIWISPISLNLEGQTAYGEAYHGFWPTNLFEINPHFGTGDDLKALSNALHDRGMFLMVDTVLNHLASRHADTDPAHLKEGNLMFQDLAEFHPYCPINFGTRESQLKCWMGDKKVALMDLNTENNHVIQTLKDGVKQIVAEYGIDGMRLDAIKHFPIQFAVDICKNAGDSYCIGEVYSSSPGEQAGYQKAGLEGLENYTLFWGFQKTFGKREGMKEILNILKAVAVAFDDVGVLGTFMENQDQVRFAQLTQDKALVYNALAFQFLTDGIPILYYGMEQDMPGGFDPENRAALWTRNGGFGMDATPTVKRVAAINKIHRAFASHPDIKFGGKNFIDSRVQVLGEANQDGAIRKGPLLTVVTNRGEGGAGQFKVAKSGWDANTGIVDLLTCTVAKVATDTSVTVTFTKGEPVVFASVVDAKAAGLCLTPEPSASASVSSTTQPGTETSTGTATVTPVVTVSVPLVVGSTATPVPTVPAAHVVASASKASTATPTAVTSCKRKRRRRLVQE